MMSGVVSYTTDSVKEVHEFMTKLKAYVGPDGRFTQSTDIATTGLVSYNLTSNI